MSNVRDRVIGVSAGLIVIALGALVIAALLSAQNNGKRALEGLQVSQVQQLARSLDAEVETGLAQASGFGGTKPWNLTPADPADAARLQALQAENPSATTGYLLVDHNGLITNGTLVANSAIGQTVARAGLVTALAQARPAVLPVGPGFTTPLPTVDAVFPVSQVANGPGGGLIIETAVAADSPFNQSVTALRRGRTVAYSFIDSNGAVVASSDTATLAKPAAAELRAPAGFHRVSGDVVVVEPVPSAGWTVAFKESAKEFEGSLTGPLHSALLLIALAAVIGAGLTFFALMARLRAAREEQRRLRSVNDAREEFISIVSHELRTPVTGQLGFLETTLDHWDGLEEGERKAAVSRAMTNARRLHALTRDILSTASIEAGELPYTFETVDVRRPVAASLAAMPAGPMVEVDTPPEPCIVRADPARVQQVMTNLLDNAVKSSPAELPIHVSVRPTADGQVMVEVRDRGTGMTDDQAKRAFEKFVRSREGGVEGTGLGLYICRRIVEAHGGRIWVAQGVVAGTTICFSLPLVPATTGASGPPAPDDRELGTPAR